jgi:predicted TIM-barrel fold metal-dependent hydrolase
MKIDTHVHLADIRPLLASGNGNDDMASMKRLSRMVRWALDGRSLSGPSAKLNDQWSDILSGWIDASSLDCAVLLALDGVYDKDGRLLPDKTMLTVDNDFVWQFVSRRPEFMFGASIHPYRKDALEELERVVARGACVVKWIPSGQHIDPADPKCYPFYEALAHYGIPLLTHTGIEHTLGSRRSRCNHPQKLVPALKAGVKVIAAHCGVHLFLHEPSWFDAWATLAKEYENLFGDLGAFAIVTRARYVRRIFRDNALMHKVLYGSDFPTLPSAYWCWQLGLAKMRSLSRVPNPLERNLQMMRALGMPEIVFENANRIFPTPKEITANAG